MAPLNAKILWATREFQFVIVIVAAPFPKHLSKKCPLKKTANQNQERHILFLYAHIVKIDERKRLNRPNALRI